eukprot:3538958-Rhodomonas_salina.1
MQEGKSAIAACIISVRSRRPCRKWLPSKNKQQEPPKHGTTELQKARRGQQREEHSMVVTALVSHPEISPLKTKAPSNISLVVGCQASDGRSSQSCNTAQSGSRGNVNENDQGGQ